MAQSVSKKMAQIRRSLRKTQIEEYRQKIRKQIMESQMQANQIKELNQVILNHIQKEQLLEIAHLIYGQQYSRLRQPLSNLSPETSLILFTFLCKQISHLYSLVILGNLIESQYAAIFLNKNNEQICVQFIQSIYKKCDKAVRTWAGQQQSSQKQQLQKIVNGFLGILKALAFNKDQKSQQQLFVQIQIHQLIPQLFVQLLEYLSGHPAYLLILIIFEYEYNISAQQPLKSILINHPQIIVKLIEQGDPSGHWHKTLFLPSITLANSCLKNIDDKSVIVKCLSPYFHITKIVQKYSQQNQQQYYKMHTFVQTLKTLVMLIGKVANEPLQPHIGFLMCKQNYWTFATVIIRTQIRQIRQFFYEMMKLAVQNMIVSGAKLQEYLTQTLIGLIIEGLDYEYKSINQFSLSTCSLILHYCQKTQNYSLLKMMNEFDVDGSLERLQYSSSKAIAKQSSQIVAEKDIISKYMEQE